MSNTEKLLHQFDPHTSTSQSTNEHHNIHLRTQHRNGGETVTTIQGLSQKSNSQRLCSELEQKFGCHGQVFQDEELGSTIELSGNQQCSDVADFLVKEGIAKKEGIKIHDV